MLPEKQCFNTMWEGITKRTNRNLTLGLNSIMNTMTIAEFDNKLKRDQDVSTLYNEGSSLIAIASPKPIFEFKPFAIAISNFGWVGGIACL